MDEQPAFNAKPLDWALYYASKGIPVFPCAHNAKEPAIKGGRGCLDATTDEAQIRAWWKKYPNANIGGATGYFHDLIDIDTGGGATFAQYEDAKSANCVLRTPSKGYHIFYAVSETQLANRAKPKGLPGLDVRTKGGYGLLPPSSIDGEFYEWLPNKELNGQILPPFPDWAIPFFREGARLEHATDLQSIFNGDLEDGRKHDQLRDAIYKMRMSGFDIEITKAVIESCISKVDPKRFKQSAPRVLRTLHRDIEHVYATKPAAPRHTWHEPPASPDDFRDTELGYAERFVATYAPSLRYLPEREEWLQCESDVWHPQPGGDSPALRKAAELARTMADEYTAQAQELAEKINPEEPASAKTLAKVCDALHKKAAGMEKAATVSNIVKLARPIAAINTNLTVLDSDPWLLGTQSGVVDLRTLEVLPYGREKMVTRAIPHPWTPEATSPIFDEFLATILCYKPELVRLMRAWIGYCMVGHNQDQKFMVWYGERGRNGKTTLWNAMSYVLGDAYAGVLDKRLILETRNPAQFALANIEGKRAVFAAEPHINSRLNAEWIKEFSGGEKMTAERKGVQGYEFRPVAKLMLALNRLPSTQFDNSLMDRMIAVPFEQSFYDKSDPRYREGDMPRDAGLERKLRDDVAGMVGFMAQCCLEYQANGLIEPAETHRLAADFEAENDLVGQWIADRCDVGDYEALKVSILYASYRHFCESIGIRSPGGINAFSRRLEQEPGLEKKKPGNVPHYSGLRLRAPDPEPVRYWAD